MPSDVKLEIFYDGAWRDLVTDDKVFSEQPITVTRGDGSESAAPRPASLVARLNNDRDTFRTSNPMSPLYGKAGRNTPVRLSVAGVVRAVTEASSWRAGQTNSFDPDWVLGGKPKRGKAYVDLESGGLLRRINQWTEPLKSPLTRGTLSLNGLVGLSPLEDGSDAAQLTQSVSGVRPGTYSGTVTLGDDERPGGATQTVKVGADGVIGGFFRGTSASGWQICFAAKLAAIPGSTTYLPLLTWRDSANRTWYWEIEDTSFRWRCVDSDGAELFSQTSTWGSGVTPNQWVRHRMKVTVSGSTITYEPAWYVEGSAVVVGTSGTFSGTSTGRLVSWEVRGNAHNTDANYANVFGLNNGTTDIITDTSVLKTFNGHVGESPRERFLRLMSEMGLPRTSVGAEGLTRMGAQPAASLADLLREIRDTEDGLIYDAIDDNRLIFLTREARYNQTPVSIDVTELPVPPAEVSDDLNTHNRVTVSNSSGAEATAEDSTGPLGTADAPDGVGVYEQTVDVNIEDETRLPELANWWLRRGTVDLPRYPQVEVNLAALSPAKRAEVEALDIGGVIEITGYRENVIRLHVLGYTETVPWKSARKIVFVCVPDQQFVIAEIDDAGSRKGSRSTSLGVALDKTATTITISTANPKEVWSRTASYDLMIGGERIGVMAGGMGAVTGSGPYTQVITGAVRSKNGVVKSHSGGATVQIADPVRIGL